MSTSSARERWVRVAAGFLALSYALGGPLTAFAEYRSQALSQRFDLPPELIYLTCAIQLVCSIGVFVRRFAPWAAALLTVVTLGAIASHLRIGSPVTALTAVFYTAIQVWFGLETRAANARSSDRWS